MLKIRETLFAGVAAALVASPPALAQSQISGAYDVYLGGFKVAKLAVRGKTEGKAYAATGKLESRGLAGMVRKVRYVAKSHGVVSRGRYRPKRYEEEADTGRRQSEAVVTYKNGTPSVKAYVPPRVAKPFDLDPKTQKGTVDPMTALFATLKDVKKSEVCALDLTLFDGRRRSKIGLSAPKSDGDKITCRGEYRRLAGYAPKDLAEKSRFPFTLTYAPIGDGMYRVMKVSMDTLYGKGALIRR